MEGSRELWVVLHPHKGKMISHMGKYIIEAGNFPPDGLNNSIERVLAFNGGKKRRVTTYVSEEMTSSRMAGGIDITDEATMLLRQCDYLFVADTNYNLWNERFLCAGAIGQLVWFEKKNQYAISQLCHTAFEVEANPETGKPIFNPEIKTWALFVKEITKSKKLKDSRIIIVVDSELGQLKQYNEGKELIDGVTLPPNVRFAYATANRNDTVLNWAIKQCDKEARKIWKELKEYKEKAE